MLCLGSGFTTKYLALHFQTSCRVVFLSRSRERLIADNLDPFDEGKQNPVLIVDSIPPDDPALPYFEICRRLVSAGSTYVHISSTSVYGGAESDSTEIRTLDETTEPEPDGPGGARRLLREQEIQAAYPRSWILRAGGIYGPGRSLVESFQRGDFRRAASGNRIVSRIHVHDLCRLALALIPPRSHGGEPIPGRVVNAVDLKPSSNSDVFSFLEELLSISIPGDWRNFPPTGRRVESRYALSLIGNFTYPDFRSGFTAIAGR